MLLCFDTVIALQRPNYSGWSRFFGLASVQLPPQRLYGARLEGVHGSFMLADERGDLRSRQSDEIPQDNHFPLVA